MPVLAAARIDHRAAPAVAVVSIALQAGRLPQPVAEVELVALPVLDRNAKQKMLSEVLDSFFRTDWTLAKRLQPSQTQSPLMRALWLIDSGAPPISWTSLVRALMLVSIHSIL
ncbi:hypothetical protein PV767_17250, partial [Stenotrophomonas rhizophila]|uniref:hypothetical protein n=1 Tax=Stenotrophomonas TaxID=40323 RepID=UPI003B7E7715